MLQNRCPLGVVGLQCSDEKPLLSLITLLFSAIYYGNSVVAICSTLYPTIALKMCEVIIEFFFTLNFKIHLTNFSFHLLIYLKHGGQAICKTRGILIETWEFQNNVEIDNKKLLVTVQYKQIKTTFIKPKCLYLWQTSFDKHSVLSVPKRHTVQLFSTFTN